LDSNTGRGGLTREFRPATEVSIFCDSGIKRSIHSKSIIAPLLFLLLDNDVEVDIVDVGNAPSQPFHTG
jgi:hypothetical protein